MSANQSQGPQASGQQQLSPEQLDAILKQATVEAMAYLDAVHNQVFFAELAKRGHVPQSEDEALAMLKTANELHQLIESSDWQDEGSIYKQAAADLGAVGNEEQGESDDWELAEFAKAAMYDPAVYAAALHLRALAGLEG